MMNPSRRWFLCLIVPLICGMRDPFAPVVDACQTAQFPLWHYRGVTQSAERLIGIVQNGEGKWQRIEQGKRLNTGWRVSEITYDNLTVDAGEGCEPRYGQWKRQGDRNDKKDKSTDVAGRAAVESSEKRHAGG